MNRYRINKIGVSNFRIFDKYFENSFKSNDLVVFDGPNGFGKTSVFDAIELVLTGIIRRLDIYDETVKNKMKAHSFPFINNEEKDFFIKIEMKSDNDNLVICRYLKKDEIIKKSKGKIRWENIKLGKLNSWDDDFENATDLNQHGLEELLGLSDLDRIFNIFFYVQQEESTFFLKHSENERKQYLNVLFDVDSETKTLEKIKKLLGFKKEYISKKNALVQKLEESKIKTESNDSVETLTYERIFKDEDYEWDKETPDFNKITYKNVIEGIQNIEKLFHSLSDFKKQKEALKIQSFLTSSNFIKNYSLVQKYETRFSTIKKMITEGKELKQILKSIEDNKFLNVDFWKIKKDFLKNHTSIEVQEVIDQVQLYTDQKSNHDKLENTRTDINKHRNNLIEKYKDYLTVSNDKNKEECPLCGNDWKDLQKLLDGVSDAEKRFLTANQASLKLVLDKISNYCNQIKQDIQNKMNSIHYPDDGVLTLIRTSLRSKQNFAELNSFLDSHGLKINELDKLKKLDDLKLLESSSQNFQVVLESELEKMMLIEQDVYIAFETIFTKYFKDSFDKLKKIEVNKLRQKINYVRSKYVDFSNTRNKKIEKRVNCLKKAVEDVRLKAAEIKKVQDIYENKIKEHISKIINDISIPFFINSGRILQEFHGGNGIFVRMGAGKTDGVKFYSDIDMDNDPLYTLSSGQISSLVLAFCLTLNDVYRKHFLGMILIDDPIQTMDEINTITFIDLIRNSFKDRQFIIATHEDNFSSLIRYKFKQNNANVSVVRMKEAI